MKHGKKFNHLGRKSQHRKATLMNLANSLIVHKRIKTTVAKAKALRLFVEPLITKSKDDSTHSRRIVFSYLKDKEAVTTLFRDVSAKVADRPGGYTRIIKLGTRYGDNAEMCYIELVDYNENLLTSKKAEKKTTRRGRSKKKSSNATATQPKTEVKETQTTEETKTQKIKDDNTAEVENKETVKEKNSETPKAEVKKDESKDSVDKKTDSPKAEKKSTPKKAENKEEKKEVKKAETPKAKTEDKKENPKKEDKDTGAKSE